MEAMIHVPRKEAKNYGDSLHTSDMHVTPDENWIIVGSQRFKRTVLPSPMNAQSVIAEDDEQLLNELEQDQ